MKINSTFHVVVSLVVLLTMSTPLIAFRGPDPQGLKKQPKQADTTAEQNPETPQVLDPAESLKMQAVADAQNDVEAYINKPMWFAIGCMLPGFGLLGPYLYRPPVPTGRTIGKPPEYVAFYTDTYKAEMEKRQFQYALTGCGTGVVAQGCLLLFWLAVID